ncbi:MAG: serine/threonine protein kinase [Myxococcales bacterium]|nr:serine/threonine protein kinase [Myxococcales bacterium]
MAPVSSPGQPLQVIGRYALFDALAAGGMATVHLGRLLGPVGFARTVAIKRLHEQFAADPEFVTSFLDEARLAARIRHPNVVPTLDVVADQGQLFLVMEYVQGESVSRLLKLLKKRDAVMPLRIAVATVAGALQGLHAAHEARSEKGEALCIVHRDVSPQNILLGADGVPRVLDFGVAKAVGRLHTTHSGGLKGKLAYMSPEQVRGLPVDRRSDVFAASIVLWEMLTHSRLFGADNEAAMLDWVLTKPIPPPSTLAPDVLPDLDAVVLKGLERDPERRWQTAREMALALEDCIPLPSAAQISAWVEGVASATLHERAERVAEVESATSDAGDHKSAVLAELRASEPATRADTPAFASSPFASVPPGEVQTGSRSAAISLVTSTPPGPTHSRLLVPLLAAVLGLLVVTLGTVLWMLGRAEPSTAATPPEVSVARTGEPAAPAQPSAPPSAAAEAPSAEPASTPVAPSASPAPPRTAPRPKPPKPAADCSVPFVRDELGRKIWKKECLE